MNQQEGMNDRIGYGMQQWHFQFKGVSIVSSSLRKALAGSAKKLWTVCTVMVLFHIYSKSLGVRLQVCPVNKIKF